MSAVRKEPKRCGWARNELSIAYHDAEWGVPTHDDKELFELLILEGAQAGLSWDTILAKRENYRRLFADFEVTKVARFTERRVAKLLQDPGIVRNRLKVQSAVTNAQAFLAVQEEYGSFDAWIWSFVGGKPRRNKWGTLAEVPASTPESELMSKELRRRGFRFVGPTICYAYMQSTGMVNDHATDCFRYRRVRG